MRRRCAVAALAVAVAVILPAASAAVTAHAVSGRLRSADLSATTVLGSALPSLLAADDFAGSRARSLDRRSTLTGQPWSVVRGEYTTAGGRAWRSGTDDGLAVALVDVDTAEIAARVQLPTASGRDGSGLVLSATADASSGVAVLYSPESESLRVARIRAGELVTVATFAVPGEPDENVALGAVRVGSVYTITVGESGPFRVTLPGEADTSTYTGLVAYGDASPSFDDWRVTLP